jgi:hypothetical protein
MDSHEIDEHAASLHSCHGQCFDTERIGLRCVRGSGWAGNMIVRAEAVVIDQFGSAIGIEAPATMGQCVPLRRVLRVQRYTIIAGRFIAAVIVTVKHIAIGVAGGTELWRLSERCKRNVRHIKRQTERKR